MIWAHTGTRGLAKKKYSDLPMDLADACLVAMAEATRDCVVVTLDREDFSIYRKNGRELIPAITPKD